MKPKIFFGVFAFLIGAIAILMLWNRRSEPRSDNQVAQASMQSGQTARNPQLEPQKPPHTSQDNSAKSEAGPAQGQTFPANISQQERLSQLEKEMRETINRPIEFYGKAVGENGMPISNAIVHFDCFIYPESQLKTNLLSDAQGSFILQGISGASLRVRVSKEGYQEMQETNQTEFVYYSPDGNGFKPDPYNPITFHLRKKEP